MSTDNAILEDYACLPENEIYRAIDFTFPEKLNPLFGINGVLKPFEAALIEGRVVGFTC